MKKALKIFGFIIISIIVILIAGPFIFESQLKDLLKKTVNENLNARVEFSDVDLSFFRSFPQATLSIEDLSIINNQPFEGDTLAIGKEVILEMSVKELFKGSGEPKRIDELILNEAFINIKIDSLGNANYDIAKEDTSTTSEGNSGFSLDLKHYEVNNSRVKYLDEQAKIALDVKELNHSGTGDFSLEESKLETHSEALVSLDYDGVNYLDSHKLSLEALLGINLKTNKYTFLENQAMVNELPLVFDGFFQVEEDHNYMDLSFKTPSSDFKNFLAVIPGTYRKNIENVNTTGDFIVNGMIFGKADDLNIPKMDISITSNNASFKYPELPKAVQDINLDLKILNDTGIAEETYININQASFRIDEDRFTTSGKLSNITENMLVDLAVKGRVNLANLSKAYPFKMEQDLNGMLTADLSMNFDMNSIEKEQYQNVNSKGTANIKNFSYKSPEIPNEVKIANADLNFNQGNVRVPDLKLTTGKTDLQASGNLENLIGFLFTDQLLKGSFKVESNTFSVNDFMIAETKKETSGSKEQDVPVASGNKAIKIPSFLDVRLDFKAATVLYDNLTLKNATGVLLTENETAKLQNISTNIFNGSIGLNGLVSTKDETPFFEMVLDLNSLDIASSFNGLELMQGLAPIAKAIEGKLQSSVNLKGKLNNDLTPQLNSLVGNALAELLTAEINPAKAALLSKLDSQLDFINLKDIDLSKLKTQLKFKDGMVELSPFTFNFKGIKAQVSGSHSFDMAMNYDLLLDVPAKYLGSEVGGALGKLSGENIQEMMVALPIGITGNFQSPQIKLNMQQAVNNLTQKIVQQQKADLQQKGLKAINDILQGKRDPKEPFVKDSTATGTQTKKDSTGTKIPTKKDSINRSQQEQVQNAAKNILGGIMKNAAKKPDTTKKNN
ncbi:AsmA-like C-terminal region-containing protein [Christiangramia salexigens]|uniref:Uncharacterized protein n=1 Tax=Christiangramia salexigens TaxID=1913577 RepID=A0A1L3J5E4_9FLAO|nr:AsmA-like C-terminal region-containing protein [Christiangramia salexigens]APG60341.1 hypothetical protein LPB144_07955 [Christiangramia salexigens]